MEYQIIILYILFSICWSIGLDIYREDISLKNIIVAIFLGWFLLPASYGTKRASEISKGG